MKFPAKDEVLAVLYDNGAIRGEMVLTGRETIDRFPAAAKFQLHFRKTNLSDLGYHPTEEYQHLRVLGSEAPGIAPVALGHTQCILLTEFIPGKSLLALSPFSFPRANPGKIANPGGLWAAAQAAYDAAEELHGAGWVHGDLHLDNILITGEGKARIIDFESLRQPQDESEFEEDNSQILDFAKAILRTGFRPPMGSLALALPNLPGMQGPRESVPISPRVGLAFC